MRTLSEIMASNPDREPFSSGTEGSAWMANWCDRCQHPVEVAWRKYEAGKRKTQLKGYEGGCPLLMASTVGKTPVEWMEQPGYRFGDQYHCIEFRGPDDGGGAEPRPKPEPSDMEGMFPRPDRRVRMLTQESQLAEVEA